MLSIIICSRNKTPSKTLADNIAGTVGIDYEIISINNSNNDYSIFSAYNAGFAKSSYPYICFVHEDVLFHTQNWGKRVIAHLQSQEAGIIGLAGGDIVTRIPANWSTLVYCVHITQSDKYGKKPTKHIRYPEDFEDPKRSVILLDGVLMCMKRNLMNKIHFDEQFKGFHGYDYDISIQSTLAGFTNYVINDIDLEHFSRGKPNVFFYRSLISVFKKWEEFLPLTGKNVTKEQLLQIPEIENKKLLRLIKKMAQTGFSTQEIIAETNYFATKIESKEMKKKIKTLKLNIFLIRLFSRPQYLLK